MTLTADLFALQEADTALDACAGALEQLQAAIGGGDELAEAQTAIADAEVARESALAALRATESELADIRAKAEPYEKRLYDGSVVNPKDLQNLQSEVDMYARMRREVEDRQLAAIEASEQAAAGVAAVRERLDALTAARAAEELALAGRLRTLEADRDRLAAERAARAARLAPQDLAQYQRLRQIKRGVAVARIVRGACTGCRITLPTNVQQRARSGMQIVRCTSCDRILHAG